MDLAKAVEFDRQAATANMESVRPGLKILEVSAKTGDGMAGWLGFLKTAWQPDRCLDSP
jgi:hydrogenase nickel incorporation protein HypB